MTTETITKRSTRFWHKEPSERRESHKYIFQTLQALKDDINARAEAYKRWLALYLNRTAVDFSPSAHLSLSDTYRKATKTQPLVINAIESCIAALAARIASQRPRAEFLTSISGPDVWDLYLRAQQLSKFVAGLWSKQRVYQKAVTSFHDAGIFGFGAIKVCENSDGDGLEFERVFPLELVIDERAAMFTDPRCFFQFKFIPAEVLKHEYDGKEQRKAIDNAIGKPILDYGELYAHSTDLVSVVEAWHLPSGKDSGDGSHVICVEGLDLVNEEYKRKRPPFAFFRFSTPIVGWYPQGLVEKESSIQEHFNSNMAKFQEALHLLATAKILAEEGSCERQHLTNRMGDILWYKPGSRPPVVSFPPTLPSELIKYNWDVYAKIFQDSGVSELSAASIKPAGIESGRAIRTLQENETGRHALRSLNWEDMFVDLAELTVEGAADVYRRRGKYQVRFLDRSFAETIDWRDVDLDRDAYELKVYPTNMLPTTPAGRLATVEELINSGLISREQGLELLSWPDLDQFQSLEGAATRDIDQQIARMLRGEQQLPEPEQALEYGIKRVISALLWAKWRGAPEERLQLLLDWKDKAQEILMGSAPPPPQDQPMGPEMAPDGMMMPPGMPPEGMPPEMMMPPPGGMPPGMQQ